MIKGFAIGKFYPFHLGHMYLIDVARANCDHLIIWVCEKAEQVVPGHIRARWIQELYPDVEVRLVPDTLADDDTRGWAEYTLRVLGEAPDVVFTSEDYGEAYAKLMGSEHVLVDKYRVHIPISGTKIRNDAIASWAYLAPTVRAYYAKRIVVLGAESTGTTTLAKALAEHYQTVWVPEYGRDYCLGWIDDKHKEWSTDEFVHIASEQSRREDEAARNAYGVLICDTDAFATSIWHKRYMGFPSPQVRKIADKRKYDLYILTGDEIPFAQDGTRDGEQIRHDMHQWFVEALEKSHRNYILVKGSHEERLKTAIEAIDKILAHQS
jgi:HTH-type transcriptional repressor of NAD biosynthesis genes